VGSSHRHEVAQVADHVVAAVRDHLGPALGEVDEVLVVNGDPGELGDQAQRGGVRRHDQAGRVRKRQPVGIEAHQRPEGAPRDGRVVRIGHHDVQPVRAAGRGRPAVEHAAEVELVGEQADPGVRDAGQHHHVQLGAGEPVGQERDLVHAGTGQQLVADDHGLPLLEGPAADAAPGPLDILAAQAPGPVLASQLDGGAERLVRRLGRRGDPDLREGGAVLLERGREQRDAGVRQSDQDERRGLGHDHTVAPNPHRTMNATRPTAERRAPSCPL
jgi:hypothetical protein